MREALYLALVFTVVLTALAAGEPGPPSRAMTSGGSAPAKLMRHPSYHDGRVAFSYRGDIWVANGGGAVSQRLTAHKAWDDFPRFSPDGKWIAFSSDRCGNFDVFVMPSQGGPPRQLTFHSADDVVVDWTPDGKRVMFQTARGIEYPHRWANLTSLFEVPLEGGIEQLVPTDRFYWGSYSPDGRKLALNRNGNLVQWWRQHYRGSGAADLWVMDSATGRFTRLGKDGYKGNYLWPMYGDNGEIYFVADLLPDERSTKPGSPEVAQSRSNIWKMPESGGEPVQVTHHQSSGLFFPAISADRHVIVYEADFGLWKLDTHTGESTEIRVRIPSGERENDVDTVVMHEADSFDLSPTGERAAISAHGEVFVIFTHHAENQQVTRSSWRDTNPRWSPDGQWLAFISDRSGYQEIWLTRPDGSASRQLTDTRTEKAGICWSPDSRSLLYGGSDRGLHRVPIESGSAEVVVASPTSEIADAQFSPDGNWISYSRAGRDGRGHVYVSPARGGEEHRISCSGSLTEAKARWTPDGRKLVFLAGNLSGGDEASEPHAMQLCVATLQRGGNAHSSQGTRDEIPLGRDPRKTEVRIEWAGLERRTVRVTDLKDGVMQAVPSPDSRTYALVSGSELYTIREDGQRLTKLAEPGRISSVQFSPDSRTLYCADGDGVLAVDVEGAGSKRRLDFTVRVEVDHRAERRQAFGETWRLFRNRFYDPDMHGVNWDRIKSVYEPLIDGVATAEEFQDLMLQMIGELNVSHARYSRARPGVSSGGQESPQARYPGFALTGDPSGYYRVSRVYAGGPADEDDVRIKVGDFILGLNGRELRAGESYWELYSQTQDGHFEFVVNSEPSKQGAWAAQVKPVDAKAQSALLLRTWVAEKRALVDRLSQGEIGYQHISEMDVGDLQTFEHELVENRPRKALIIDVRFNPGGGISQELLAILHQRQYQALRSPRVPGLEISRPHSGFFGPIAVLQNEISTSDTELFADGFRALGIGKVVGVPSFGAACASSVFNLIDGSTAIVPTLAFCSTEGYNLENRSVAVDVYVENTPEDFLAGRDRQLERCVEVLQDALRAQAGPHSR